MAACTLLFDQKQLNWSADLLRLSGIDGRLMCDPLPSGTPIGEVTAAASQMTGLPTGTPVVLGGHDDLCGALPVARHTYSIWGGATAADMLESIKMKAMLWSMLQNHRSLMNLMPKLMSNTLNCSQFTSSFIQRYGQLTINCTTSLLDVAPVRLVG